MFEVRTEKEAAEQDRRGGNSSRSTSEGRLPGQDGFGGRVDRSATVRWPSSLRSVLELQRCVGNRAVVTILRQAEEPTPTVVEPGQPATGAEPMTMTVTDELVPDPGESPPDTAPPARGMDRGVKGFVDEDMIGTVPFGDAGDLRHSNRPHAFTDGGMTGTVAWSGGGGAGAAGNEGTGTIQTQIPPTYTASAGPDAGKFSSAITAGTGTLGVSRSWRGAFSGDQGNGWFLTANAVARINQHERNHVASTRGLYNTHLAPLEVRIANPALGVNAGSTAAAAIWAHQVAIKWTDTITAFQTADTAANKKGGTVDSADVAAGWIQDLGPGNVAGVAFTHRVVRAGEAAPPP